MEIRLKKYLTIFILTFSIFLNYSLAQQGWYNLNTSFGGGGIFFKAVPDGIVGSYKTSNGGISWNYMGYLTGGSSISFPNQNTGYGVTSNYIYKTTNFGDSWVEQLNPTNQFLNGIYFPSVNIGYACGDFASIIKTANGGNNWMILNPPLPRNFHGVFFTDSITGYIVGHRIDTSTILKTTNGGINWNAQSFQTNVFGRFYSLFFINSNTGIVGSSGYIFKTTNAGLNWFTIYPPTQNIIHSLYFPSGSTGYGACYGGQIIKTTNGGNNWFLQNTGTGSILYSIFFINNLTGYASGGNNTVLKTTDGGGPPIGIIPISNNIPEKYQLFQNYPNPFNPITSIKYSLKEDVNVKIVIYNILGQTVKTLINEYQQAGYKEVIWDGYNNSGIEVASGIYIYKIIAGDYTNAKKMLLLK